MCILTALFHDCSSLESYRNSVAFYYQGKTSLLQKDVNKEHHLELPKVVELLLFYIEHLLKKNHHSSNVF